jgi:hypothetical protein
MRTLTECLYVSVSGLYSGHEHLAFSVAVFLLLSVNLVVVEPSAAVCLQIVEALFFLCMNVFECYGHGKYELQSFQSKIVANKLSIQYINYVNRLLPKHVGSPHRSCRTAPCSTTGAKPTTT